MIGQRLGEQIHERDIVEMTRLLSHLAAQFPATFVMAREAWVEISSKMREREVDTFHIGKLGTEIRECLWRMEITPHHVLC